VNAANENRLCSQRCTAAAMHAATQHSIMLLPSFANAALPHERHASKTQTRNHPQTNQADLMCCVLLI